MSGKAEVSAAAYEAACDRYTAAAELVNTARDALAAAELELERATDALAEQEAYPGIPLWNRCPTCPADAPFDVRPPAGHAGPCAS